MDSWDLRTGLGCIRNTQDNKFLPSFFSHVTTQDAGLPLPLAARPFTLWFVRVSYLLRRFACHYLLGHAPPAACPMPLISPWTLAPRRFMHRGLRRFHAPWIDGKHRRLCRASRSFLCLPRADIAGIAILCLDHPTLCYRARHLVFLALMRSPVSSFCTRFR